MKASYILALIAAFAVSSISAGVSNSKVQGQKSNGNNGVVASADNNLVGAPGLAQGGVNVLTDKTNIYKGSQSQQQ